MTYKVQLSAQAKKVLKKLDPHTAQLLLAWMRKNLDGCTDPRIHGKALSANLAGLWRYRVGDYRLIADISEETITILILNIGHRKDVYE